MILLVAGIFAVVGIGLVASGVGEIRRRRAFRREAIQVQARVTEVRRTVLGSGAQRMRGYSPVVSFRTRDGETIQALPSQSRANPPHRVGQTVTTWYSHADPSVVEVAGMATHIIPWFLIPGGAVVAAVGIVVGLVNLS